MYGLLSDGSGDGRTPELMISRHSHCYWDWATLDERERETGTLRTQSAHNNAVFTRFLIGPQSPRTLKVKAGKARLELIWTNKRKDSLSVSCEVYVLVSLVQSTATVQSSPALCLRRSSVVAAALHSQPAGHHSLHSSPRCTQIMIWRREYQPITHPTTTTRRHCRWKIRLKPDSEIMYCSTQAQGLRPELTGLAATPHLYFVLTNISVVIKPGLSLSLSLSRWVLRYLFVFNVRLTKRCEFLSTQLNCVWLWLCLWRYYEWQTGKKSLLIPDKITTTLLVWTITIMY